ncbi:MAG: RES family NAD+ phosphorylase [Candidatus Omnitrophica bacterium]|nr:RES family NAD+ phosphorylase [Candidatus Omnitrophota bacterium]
MATFVHSFDWEQFKDYVKNTNRHFFHDEVGYFLTALEDVALKRKQTFITGSRFYRARKGPVDIVDIKKKQVRLPGPFDPADMGIPPPHLRFNGRVNCAGMGCLYVATDKETAISEIKPYISEKISVGTFVTKSLIKVVDLTLTEAPPMLLFLFNQNATESDLQDCIWGQISREFSIPVIPGNGDFAYIATQVVSEFFKSKGFDGVRYCSSLTTSAGQNVALFSEALVECEKTELFEVKTVRTEASLIPTDSFKGYKMSIEEGVGH